MKKLILSFTLISTVASAQVTYYYEGYDWYLAFPPLSPEWHVLSVNDLRSKCQDSNPNACAYRDVTAGVCHIYASQSEEQTPKWLRWHELLHCAGWNHNKEHNVNWYFHGR